MNSTITNEVMNFDTFKQFLQEKEGFVAKFIVSSIEEMMIKHNIVLSSVNFTVLNKEERVKTHRSEDTLKNVLIEAHGCISTVVEGVYASNVEGTYILTKDVNVHSKSVESFTFFYFI